MHYVRVILWSILLINFTAFRGSAQINQAAPVDRPMAAAGKFYPGNPEELRKLLQEMFSQTTKPTVRNVLAVIAPHAGYAFSGQIAASSFRQIDPDKEYENVFVIGSSHFVSFDGASIYSIGDYQTPLGKVPVNRELAARLIRENPCFGFFPSADEKEHSVEVQVPFLQYYLKKSFRIIPIIIGTGSAETCKKIALALQPYFNDKNLFVISTDFSHYPSYQDAKMTDKRTADAIVSNSPVRFQEAIHKNDSENIPDLATSLCGWTSVLTMLYMTSTDPAIKIVPLLYRNSGDVPPGDKKHVVGYWSMAIIKSAALKTGQNWFKINDKDKEDMLALSRLTLEKYIREGVTPAIDPSEYGNALKQKNGVFITLREQGELRGCIGRIKSDVPLYQLIQEMTIAAATEDPRFRPVGPGEVSQVEIDISILSPLRKIRSIDEIIVGKHGILIRKGEKEGTLLPQVATENKWTREELLGYCAKEKAGLGWDGWKTADIFIYEAAEFSEKQFSGNKD